MWDTPVEQTLCNKYVGPGLMVAGYKIPAVGIDAVGCIESPFDMLGALDPDQAVDAGPDADNAVEGAATEAPPWSKRDE